MNLMQGDIVLVRYPFSNMVDYKIRPALIVSNDLFNKQSDPWACPISSKNINNYIDVSESLIEGKLNKKSFVKTSAIAFLDVDLILKKIGSIKKEKMKQISVKIIANL